jgi:hypothetical protein
MRLMAVIWMWLVLGSVLWTVPSRAAVLDPMAVTSLGELNTTDPISINTDRLQLTGGASSTGVLDPVSGAGIFTFDSISGAKRISLANPDKVGLQPPEVTSGPVFIGRTVGINSRIVSLLGQRDQGIAPPAGIGGGTITLRAATTSSSGGATSGQVLVALSSSSLSGSPAVALAITAASVPVPAAFLLFATGLAALGAMKMRKR